MCQYSNSFIDKRSRFPQSRNFSSYWNSLWQKRTEQGDRLFLDYLPRIHSSRFAIADWMMVLPEELQQKFKEELSRYQEDSQMPFLSRIELDAKQEGILLTLREDVITILEVRFGEVTPELIEVLNSIKDVPVLKQLLRQAIAIPSIEEFQQLLEQALRNEEHLAGES